MSWRTLQSTGEIPGVRWDSIGFVRGDSLFILGGTKGPMQACHLMDLYRCDLKTGIWSKVPVTGQVPSPRGGANAIVLDNRLLVFGGYVTSEPETLGFVIQDTTIFSLDLETYSWSKLKCAGKAPSPRWGSGMVATGNSVWLYGGTEDWYTPTDGLYLLECEGSQNATWTSIPYNTGDDSTQSKLVSPALLLAGDSLIRLLGDGCYYGGGHDAWIADTTERPIQWTTLETKIDSAEPEAYIAGGAYGLAQFGDRVLIFGPQGVDGAHVLEPGELLTLDSPKQGNSELTWSVFQPGGAEQPKGRVAHITAKWRDSLVVFGGGSADEHQIDDRVWLLSPDGP